MAGIQWGSRRWRPTNDSIMHELKATREALDSIRKELDEAREELKRHRLALEMLISEAEAREGT